MNKIKGKAKLFQHWKKYLLEFLMLFLAVFLGFFADNFRDKISEKSREKEYIQSLIEDVKTDKIIIDRAIRNNTVRKSYLDQLSKACFNFTFLKDNNWKLYKYYPMVLQKPDFFVPNNLTMFQLKNAGGLRLIQNKEAVKAILSYDIQKTLVSNQEKYYENYHNNAINLGLRIFNHQPMPEMMKLYKTNDTLKLKTLDYKLIETDIGTLTQFGNQVMMYSGIVNYYNILLRETNRQADSLISTLKVAYKSE